MDLTRITQLGPWCWTVPHVPADVRAEVKLFGNAQLLETMDDKVLEQITNVARLPGLVGCAMTMPDAHWGYGFPIGGVAAFDPEQGGIISAGGVGFDISCGIRCLRTNLDIAAVELRLQRLADALYRNIPAGIGEEGELKLAPGQLDEVLRGGAQWAVQKGYGNADDLDYVEEHGRVDGAMPQNVSPLAKKRQRGEMGTLGSGNHYLEVQVVEEILTHITRSTFTHIFSDALLETLFDVSHNTCKAERHQVGGRTRLLYIHRKGATRAFGPGHPALPVRYREAGQPVIIGGSMGTASWILAGTKEGEARAFSSASHGAGRAMSRHQALRRWQGRQLVDELARQGILIRTRSMRGAAEEAPGAYKDVDVVAQATEAAGLARRVARLRPRACIKG
jgi:RNA-splicing ligase RtcB